MKRREAIVLTLMAAAAVSAGCRRTTVAKDTIKNVKTELAAPYGVQQCVEFPGKVQAASEANLSFRISGPIEAVAVHEGDFVRKGDVMAMMDSRDYEVQLAATEAQYNQIKAEAERVIRLYGQESVSANDYDKAVSGLSQITAKYDAHRNALADTRLRAPMDGYVRKIFFKAGETVGAGMPVVSMIGAGSPEVEIHIPADEYIRREQFDSFDCRFNIYPDKVFPLELLSISPQANLNQLYTVRLRMTGTGGELPAPGMSTMVSIHMRPEAEAMTAVPVSAMYETDGQPCVWVYDEETGKVHERRIAVREILADGRIVVREGVEAGERIVTAGVHSLADGQSVRPILPQSDTNSGGLL